MVRMRFAHELLAVGVLGVLVGQPAVGQKKTAAPAVPADVQQHIDKVVSCLHGPVIEKGDPCVGIEARMAELHIPGVSVAVIHNGVIEWARGFGVERVGGPAVTAETLFQAGSISKPVAAMAALRLVQQGKLSLNADVNTELVSWKVPQANALVEGGTVTLHELLTHTAGMTVHGFPGYAVGAPVPTLVQVLNGEKPANTGAIRVADTPGKKWNYSGGGFTIMQQMVVDATKEPFPKVMHDTVLAPIGMTHSTYEQPLPEAMQGHAATPYDGKGEAVKGGAHTYPEMAAAGLWTTPTDVAKYAIENEQSLVGKANHVLSKEMTEQMMTPGIGNWGLGVQIGGAEGDRYFSHGGSNAGFEGQFVAYEKHGDGAVVLTNAQGGGRIAQEVIQSIAAEYGWPDFRPVVRASVKVDPAVLAKYVGTYALSDSFSITYTLEGDQLMTQATNQGKFPMFPESETKFFLKVVDAETEFFTNDKGEVTYMVLYQGGREMKGLKK
jgi:CubicO group peptidase (beta-lactamase class C family)